MRFLLTYSLLLIQLAVFGQQNELVEEDLRKSIFFGGGSYYITEDQVEGIKEFFDKFESIENYEITISGHTDNIGDPKLNIKLSQERADKVKLYLVKKLSLIHI